MHPMNGALGWRCNSGEAITAGPPAVTATVINENDQNYSNFEKIVTQSLRNAAIADGLEYLLSS